ELVDTAPRISVVGQGFSPPLTANLARLVSEPFDLTHGPVVRAALYQLADEEWIFAVVMHHVVADGGSSAVVVRELGAAYRAALEGRAIARQSMAIRYSDYAAWQRRVLDGDRLASLAEYWKSTLADAPPAIELPTDFPRPVAQSYRGGMFTF